MPLRISKDETPTRPHVDAEDGLVRGDYAILKLALERAEAECARLRGLLHRVYGEAIAYNEEGGWHECRRCHGKLLPGGMQHKPQCAWKAVEDALNIERG